MLKREVPTGPAADLLRKLLHEGGVRPSDENKVREFLDGAPAHSPLPWVSEIGDNSKLRDIFCGAPGSLRILEHVLAEDAELVLVAVNNFYALREAAVELFEALVENRRPGRTVAQIDDLQALLHATGSDKVPPVDGVGSFETMRPKTATPPSAPAMPAPPMAPTLNGAPAWSGPLPAPVGPMPSCPTPPGTPLPRVGSQTARPDANYFVQYDCWLTNEEYARVLQVTALPAR